MEKYALVVVDLQYDFYHPDGSMHVNGAETLPTKVANFIMEHKDEIDEVIFTLDWHPTDHCSFKEQGGIWPVHCVAHTLGASLPLEVITACDKAGIKRTKFLKKGVNFSYEQYGAGDWIECSDGRPTPLSYFAIDYYPYMCELNTGIITDNRNFVFCGLCGDYCVKESMRNFMKCKYFTVKAIPSLTLSIDGGEKFNQFISENNIETI